MSHFTLGVVNVGGGECRGGECRTIPLHYLLYISKKLGVGAGAACCAGRRGDGADFTGSPTKKD